MVWSPTFPVELAGLSPLRDSEGRGINSAGQACGWVYLPPPEGGCRFRAAVWDTDLTFFNLGSVMPDGQDGQESRAEAVNNLPQPRAVGWNVSANVATLWINQGGFTNWSAFDLNDLVPQCSQAKIDLRQAHDINDDNWVIAVGDSDTNQGGVQWHAFVLTPIETCLWDLNGDGEVGILDLLTLLAAWGPCTDGELPLGYNAAVHWRQIRDMKNQNREQVDLAQSLLSAAAAGALMLCIPGQAQDCGDDQLTQSLSLEIVDGGGVACATGAITSENSFARCYLPSGEPFTLRCVDLGVEINTGSDLPAAVNIYIDVDGCPPTHPDIDLVLVASEPFIVPAGTFLELFEIEFSDPVLINAGETLVVELDYPAHTDGGVWPGMNSAGQTASTYVRSEPCGVPNYIPITPGFGRYHWVQVVKGALPCPADLDGDGSVGILDLLVLLAAWGTDPGGPPDFDGDGIVGILDLLTLLANWGPCP